MGKHSADQFGDGGTRRIDPKKIERGKDRDKVLKDKAKRDAARRDQGK